MPLHKNSRLILYFLAVSVLAATSLECQALLENFRTMRVDPVTLKAELDGLLPLWPSPDHEFYQRSNSYTPTIAHLGPDGSYIAYNVFEVNPDGTLSTRSKSQILMHGPYGTVFAQSKYYYGKQYNHQPMNFGVTLYFNEGGHEPAQPARMLDQVGALSAISLVRVFKAPPEFLVVCATYDADGHMLVLGVNGSENGNWVHPSQIRTLYPDFDLGTSYADSPVMREHFGLPETFPIADYLKSPQNEAQKVALSIYSDTINLHYQRNRYVRQDTFRVDGSHSTDFFKYMITPEDRQLEPIDDRIKFGSHNPIAQTPSVNPR
jgi:hypothetical protein